MVEVDRVDALGPQGVALQVERLGAVGFQRTPFYALHTSGSGLFRLITVAVVGVVALPFVALAQNWEVIAPPNSSPSAVGCIRPDVLGDSLRIAVDLDRDGPKVWMFGDRDALWDTVAVSVDDGEVFVALSPHDPAPQWTAAEGARLIQALQTGSQAFVSTGIDEAFVDLDGPARVIDDVLSDWQPVR